MGGGGGGGGDNFCGRGTISASGLCPRGDNFRNPRAQNLRGNKICSDIGRMARIMKSVKTRERNYVSNQNGKTIIFIKSPDRLQRVPRPIFHRLCNRYEKADVDRMCNVLYTINSGVGKGGAGEQLSWYVPPLLKEGRPCPCPPPPPPPPPHTHTLLHLQINLLFCKVFKCKKRWLLGHSPRPQCGSLQHSPSWLGGRGVPLPHPPMMTIGLTTFRPRSTSRSGRKCILVTSVRTCICTCTNTDSGMNMITAGYILERDHLSKRNTIIQLMLFHDPLTVSYTSSVRI